MKDWTLWQSLFSEGYTDAMAAQMKRPKPGIGEEMAAAYADGYECAVKARAALFPLDYHPV